MTTARDPRTRIVLSWLREDAHENAERVLLRALDEVVTTPQRRAWWPAWRTNRMNPFAKLVAGAAAVLVVAVVGFNLLPSLGKISPGAAQSPSSSSALLARGDFGFAGGGYVVALEATGEGSTVTGRMIVSEPVSQPGLDTVFTVDLQCTRTTDDGVIMIGGITMEGNGVSPEGTWAAIVLEPGSPVKGQVLSQRGGPGSSATSCLAYLDEKVPVRGGFLGLAPIEGSLELGPAQ